MAPTAQNTADIVTDGNALEQDFCQVFLGVCFLYVCSGDCRVCRVQIWKTCKPYSSQCRVLFKSREISVTLFPLGALLCWPVKVWIRTCSHDDPDQ